jgi:hypothetical protein
MKKQLILNRKLYELDLLEQNKYLGNKINSMKPVIKSSIPNLFYRNEFIKSLSKKQSTH